MPIENKNEFCIEIILSKCTFESNMVKNIEFCWLQKRWHHHDTRNQTFVLFYEVLVDVHLLLRKMNGSLSLLYLRRGIHMVICNHHTLARGHVLCQFKLQRRHVVPWAGDLGVAFWRWCMAWWILCECFCGGWRGDVLSSNWRSWVFRVASRNKIGLDICNLVASGNACPWLLFIWVESCHWWRFGHGHVSLDGCCWLLVP